MRRLRVWPSPCNPSRYASQQQEQRRQVKSCGIKPRGMEACHQENDLNQKVYYQREFSLFSKCTQTEPVAQEILKVWDAQTALKAQDGQEAGLSLEDKRFLEQLTWRIKARKCGRLSRPLVLLRRFLAFLVFFFLQGCIAAYASQYGHSQQYQSFLATQFCGFVTIMFWDG